MEKNVTSMSRGIMTNVDVSVKKTNYMWNWLCLESCYT